MCETETQGERERERDEMEGERHGVGWREIRRERLGRQRWGEKN